MYFPPLHFFSTHFFASVSWAWMFCPVAANSPLPEPEQNRQPPVPRVPSRLGQVKPPSRESL